MFKEIELFLFDLDGTIYIGDREIEGSFDAIRRLKKLGKRICFFTNNSSRAVEDYLVKLAKMGYQATEDEIYSSAQVTCEYISRNFPDKSAFVMGNEKLKSEFTRHGITLDENNADLLVLGFDTTLTYDRLYRFCIELAKGKYYIATHPDIVCPAEPAPMPDTGAIMLMIEASTGRKADLIMGKPNKPAGDGVKNRFQLPSQKIAMVGDRLYTDVAFGNNNDFLSVLVLSGETDMEMAVKSDTKADVVFPTVSDLVDAVEKEYLI